MQRVLDRWMLGLALVVTLMAAAGPWCRAAEMVKSRDGAVNEQYQQLLRAAAQQQPIASSALAALIERSPDDAQLRSQAGYIRRDGSWIRYDTARQQQAYVETVREYEHRRSTTLKTAEAQFALGQWCAERAMSERASAHWQKALELKPDLELARQRLGMVFVDPWWITREQHEALEQRNLAARQAMTKWSGRLTTLAIALESPASQRRAQALAELKTIREPEAFVPLETYLSARSDDLARLVVEHLATVSGEEATLSLARHAVYAGQYTAGREAAEHLRDRPRDQYMPMMIASLAAPAETRVTYHPMALGGFMARYSIVSERLTHQEQVNLQRQFGFWYQPIGRVSPLAVIPSSFDGRSKADRARVATAIFIRQASAEAEQIRGTVDERNRATEAWNHRVTGALAVATGLDLPNDPRAWWDWWNVETDRYVPPTKPSLVETYTETEVKVVPVFIRYHSCLTAGTTIWTDMGPRAVEMIEVGDLVLARDVDGGQLAYKPVLRTTVRDPAPLVSLTTARGKIDATGGHPWWICGKGWTKTRDLRPGMLLLTVDGTATVESVYERAAEPTFNLVVDGFHSYFVGPDALLSHDNTPSDPVRHGMPGMTGE
jgi:hypothetical protein